MATSKTQDTSNPMQLTPELLAELVTAEGAAKYGLSWHTQPVTGGRGSIRLIGTGKRVSKEVVTVENAPCLRIDDHRKALPLLGDGSFNDALSARYRNVQQTGYKVDGDTDFWQGKPDAALRECAVKAVMGEARAKVIIQTQTVRDDRPQGADGVHYDTVKEAAIASMPHWTSTLQGAGLEGEALGKARDLMLENWLKGFGMTPADLAEGDDS